jgi:hypothetical protein
MDFLTNALAQKKWVDLLFLDFEKAFDKVPHRRLLLKLKAYGLSGILLKWIEAFLRGRKQRMVLGEEMAENVPSGKMSVVESHKVQLSDHSCSWFLYRSLSNY